MVYAQNKKFKGVHIVVKNNILLTVLLASFAAPVFASLIPSKCPYETTAQKVGFVGAVLAVDELSSRFTALPRAVEFSRPVSKVVSVGGVSSTILKAQVDALTDTHDKNRVNTDETVIVNVRDNLYRALDSQKLAEANAARPADSKSWLQKLLDTGVTVDVCDYNVCVKVVPAAVKVVATYATIEAARAAVARVTGK